MPVQRNPAVTRDEVRSAVNVLASAAAKASHPEQLWASARVMRAAVASIHWALHMTAVIDRSSPASPAAFPDPLLIILAPRKTAAVTVPDFLSKWLSDITVLTSNPLAVQQGTAQRHKQCPFPVLIPFCRLVAYTPPALATYAWQCNTTHPLPDIRSRTMHPVAGSAKGPW